jgi:hypothetical protein
MWGSWIMFSGCPVPRYCSGQTNNKEWNLGNTRRNDAERMRKFPARLEQYLIRESFVLTEKKDFIYIRRGSKITIFVLRIIGCSLSIIVF